MRNKIVIMLSLCLIALSSSCFAMTFSQPIKLGSASATDASFYTYETKGAKYNKNGIAKFGDDNNAIWFYQRPATTQYCYGGSSLDKTFPFLSAYGCEFSQIKTSSRLVLYMVHEWEFDIRGEKYILLGMQSDGKWVKYFDTRDIKTKYFGEATSRKDIPCFVRWQSNGDTISVVYQRVDSGTKRLKGEGEFRFKWDEAAQWFGIEQVVY